MLIYKASNVEIFRIVLKKYFNSAVFSKLKFFDSKKYICKEEYIFFYLNLIVSCEFLFCHRNVGNIFKDIYKPKL